MRGWRAPFLAVALAACGIADPPPPAPPKRPQRIVSLDYCADQFVLKLADRDQIAAVSTGAVKEFSYMRAAARGVPAVRARAEEALLLRPDLVVRAYGGGPRVTGLLARAGVPVAQVGYAEDLEGVRRTVRDMAAALGQPARGEALVREMDASLARIHADARRPSALYVTPGGVTTGPGSLVDELMRAAGYRNFETTPGWRPLPLERLVAETPDMVAFARFGATDTSPWTATRHPQMRAVLAQKPVAMLDGAWTDCGGWFAVEAVETMAAQRGDAP